MYCKGIGTPAKYSTTSPTALAQLSAAVNAISAHGGGDCPELGMTGILNGLSLSSQGGSIIVLTDASAKDDYRTDEVIQAAFELGACVNFIFSRTGCGTSFSNYRRVSQATKGSDFNDLISFNTLANQTQKTGFRLCVEDTGESTLIGGEVCPEKSTSKLMTWTGVSWQELYPAMHTARSKPGVLLVEDYILVSGGIADGRAVDTIEVMNVNTRQWIKANLKLPRPLAQHIMALCGEYIYIYHWNSFICRMEKKNCIASLTGKEESSWQQIEKAPPAASLLQHSVQPVIAGIKGILTYEKKKWISIGEHLSVYYTTMASLNENSFITFGGERKGLQDYLKTVVQYSIAVEVSKLID